LVVNLSLCATKEFVNEENLQTYAKLAKQLGIAFIWLLEPHATGHYEGLDVALSEQQITMLQTFYEQYNFDKKFKDYPAVAYPAYHQRRVGCLGSGNRFIYIDSNGKIKSCPMCGSAHGNAETVDIDMAIKSLQAIGCGPFRDA